MAETNKSTLYAPKYRYGSPIIFLDFQYNTRPIKLFTGWSDLQTVSTPVAINGGIIPDSQIGVAPLVRGMFVTMFNDNNVYIVVPEVLL